MLAEATQLRAAAASDAANANKAGVLPAERAKLEAAAEGKRKLAAKKEAEAPELKRMAAHLAKDAVSEKFEFSLREVGGLCVVGQQQPVELAHGLASIPKPHSHEQRELLGKRVMVNVQRQLFPRVRPDGVKPDQLKWHQPPGGGDGFWCCTRKLQDCMVGWPPTMATLVREQLELVAVPIRRGHLTGYWEPDPDRRMADADVRRHCTPEELAVLDASLHAEKLLRDRHITRLNEPDGLARKLDALKGSAAQRVTKKAVAVFIEEELQLAPWTLTANLHAHRHGRCLLHLGGVADPSNRGEAHSFTKVPTRAERGAAKDADGDSAAAKARARWGEAELAKAKLNRLKKDDCVRLLSSHGYSRADVEAMGKRDRVAIVRSIASSAAAEGLDISKYARDPDASAKGKLTAQQMNAAGAKIWEAQIRALAKTAHPDADAAADELGSDDSDAMADEMEAMLDREAEKGVSAAQDARDLDRMRREQIYADNGFRREAEAPPPGRTGLTGAVAEVAGLGRRPRQVKTGRQLLKKTEWVTNAQGEYVQRVSYDDDQAAVEKFRRKQIAEKKRTRQVLSIEESAEEKERKREAHRLEEEGRRLRRRLQGLAEIERMQREGRVEQKKESGQVRCSKCGLLGHMKNWKECPLFDEKESLAVVNHETDEVHRTGSIRQDHADGNVKLKINKDRLEANLDRDAMKKKHTIKIKQSDRESVQKQQAEDDFRNAVNKPTSRAGPAKGRTDRKAGSAVVKLNMMLGKILEGLMPSKGSANLAFAPFAQPAQKVVHNYDEYIRAAGAEPMDLSTMLRKTKEPENNYRRVADFLGDLRRIADNCHIFNTARGINLDLWPEACKLQAAGEAALARVRAEVDQHERTLVEEDQQKPLERTYRPVSKKPGRRPGATAATGYRSLAAGDEPPTPGAMSATSEASAEASTPGAMSEASEASVQQPSAEALGLLDDDGDGDGRPASPSEASVASYDDASAMESDAETDAETDGGGGHDLEEETASEWGGDAASDAASDAGSFGGGFGLDDDEMGGNASDAASDMADELESMLESQGQ